MRTPGARASLPMIESVAPNGRARTVSVKKLRFLFKCAVVMTIFFVIFVAFFLEELEITGNGFVKSCREGGIALPLDQPRIEVDVSDGTMTIFDGDKVVRRYDVACGENRRNGVVGPGSNSTPIGEYTIRRKAIRESLFRRGSRFLELDFPSEDDLGKAFDGGLIDRDQYQRALDCIRDGRVIPGDIPLAGHLGIQGNYYPFMGSRFTDGSVALKNGDIVDFFDYIPVGSRVVIKD